MGRTSKTAMVALGGLMALVVAVTWEGPRSWTMARTGAALAGGGADDRDADRAAIETASRDFSAAFARQDAKAVAAHWTVNGEYHGDDGTSLRGRKAIEDAFAEHFKEKRAGKVHVVIESIRFPAKDLAIEEGLLKQEGVGKELPTSTRYSVLHVREGGAWKIAVAREWGATEDRLVDLEWLLGAWTARAKDATVSLTFKTDKNKPFLVGEFTKTAGGKVVAAGSLKIGLEPRSGQIHSWHFDDDGGHGQARWHRDGNRWLLDAAGVTAAGARTGGINILTRVGPNEIIWQSVERFVGDLDLPDTTPLQLSRSQAAN